MPASHEALSRVPLDDIVRATLDAFAWGGVSYADFCRTYTRVQQTLHGDTVETRRTSVMHLLDPHRQERVMGHLEHLRQKRGGLFCKLLAFELTVRLQQAGYVARPHDFGGHWCVLLPDEQRVLNPWRVWNDEYLQDDSAALYVPNAHLRL